MSELAGPGESAREALAHLQAAAHELIGAARSLLDVTDELIQDPAPIIGGLSALITAFRADNPPHNASAAPAAGGRVQHIRVN